MIGAAVVEHCYSGRLEAAEKRYARMKGLVSASLEAQYQLKLENKFLRVVKEAVQQGLEQTCPITLNAILAPGGSTETIASELHSLTTRLKVALEENEKLMAFNRELRGESVLPMAIDAVASPATEENASEISTLRARITALELDCCRLESRPELFDHSEKLRECEDVFDQMLGRDRLDYCVEDVPGSSLQRFHPIGTCKTPSCVAYAKRLRGGLRRVVTEAYARERNERMNGFINHYVKPAAVIQAEKDLEIRALNERIARFEQTMRMTSGEADQVQLHVVSHEIVEAMTELGRLRSECTRLRAECLKWNAVLVDLDSRERETSARLSETLVELNLLQEERSLVLGSRDMLAEERHRLEAVREEILQFKDGRMGAAYKEKKAQVEILQRQVDGLCVKLQSVDVESVVSPVVEVSDEVSAKKAKRASRFDKLPNDGGVLMACRCGDRVLISQVAEHVHRSHNIPEKRILVCSAGCGFFVTNGSRSDVDKHSRSSSCSQRLAEIRALID
jgi:hypothetical protein